METIVTNQQVNKVNTDVNVRMRHHAQAVQHVADVLKACVFGNPSLEVSAFNRGPRYGYCYKVITPSNNRLYITYNHHDEEIFVKDSLRSYTVIHTFNNHDSDMDIILAARRIFV